MLTWQFWLIHQVQAYADNKGYSIADREHITSALWTCREYANRIYKSEGFGAIAPVQERTR